MEPVRETKPPPIFISKPNDTSSFRQLLNQIANDEFDLKNINTSNFKIQIKSSIAYTNIAKEFKTRNIEFHTYKPKQERSFKVALKHIPPEEKIDKIMKDIEELGHKVTNIWNIKNRGTKVPLNMFYVELKTEKTTRISTKQHMCSVIQLNSRLTQNAKFRNALTASGTVIQKAFAIEKRKASSVQEIICLLTVHEKLKLRMSNACYVKEITQPIIKHGIQRSTKKTVSYTTEERNNSQTTIPARTCTHTIGNCPTRQNLCLSHKN